MSTMRTTGSYGYNALCDVCGFKYKASQLKKRWDGLMVCNKDFELRHPMDFYTTRNDAHLLPWTRSNTNGIAVDPSISLTNWGLTSNNGIASGSSQYGSFFASYTVDGLTYSDEARMWADNQPNIFPKTLSVSLDGAKRIKKVVLVGLQDSYGVTPTINPITTPITGSLWGSIDFSLDVREESGNYRTVTNIYGNNLVAKEILFDPILTQLVRVRIHRVQAADGLARVVELQVWGE